MQCACVISMTTLLGAQNMKHISHLDYFTLNIEAAWSSEKSVNIYQTMRRYTPEDSNNHCHENIKSHTGTQGPFTVNIMTSTGHEPSTDRQNILQRIFETTFTYGP
jgi:hypothetical protein